MNYGTFYVPPLILKNMINFDSLSLKLPIDALQNIKNMYADNMEINNKRRGNLTYEIVNQDPIPTYGIGKCKVSEENIFLNFSAKVLLDNYLEGINKNTIENAIENFNKVSNIIIDKNKIMEASVMTCDSTQMIRPKHGISDSISSMLLLRTNNNFMVKKWAYNGVELNHKIKTGGKRRMIMYNKFNEITKKSKSKFLVNCKKPMKLVNSTKGLLRVELNTTSFKDMRNRFFVAENNLGSMLLSQRNPNYNFIKKYSDSINQLEIFENVYSTTDQCIKDLGRREILKQCNYDFDIIRHFLKTNTNAHRKTITRHIKALKDTMNQIQQRQLVNGKNPYLIKENIVNLIKEAV